MEKTIIITQLIRQLVADYADIRIFNMIFFKRLYFLSIISTILFCILNSKFVKPAQMIMLIINGSDTSGGRKAAAIGALGSLYHRFVMNYFPLVCVTLNVLIFFISTEKVSMTMMMIMIMIVCMITVVRGSHLVRVRSNIRHKGHHFTSQQIFYETFL